MASSSARLRATCALTRERHREIDRLGHVIVGAKLQRLDDIVALRARRHHDDRQRRCGLGLTQPAERFDAVHLGIMTSSKTTSKLSAFTCWIAWEPLSASTTSKPRR
ncbi:MAG: hypothetical protein R3D69_01700 [Xanthobacteraceae bacterium]